MFIFGSGMSAADTARAAAVEAATDALRAFASSAGRPKLAVVFASISYPDVESVVAAVRGVVGPIPIVGGSSGAYVLGPRNEARRGVSVVLLGGDDLEVAIETPQLGSPELVDVVPAAAKIARAADEAAKKGLIHYSCLVFAPGIFVDGELLVAAVRKGAGVRAQLAGGLTGDEMTMDRPKVFVGEELRRDRAVLAGLFTRKHVGIAARHGWRPIAPTRTVTRAEGPVLMQLDGRPALDVWLEDARRGGAILPEQPKELTLYLANHYEIGIVDLSRSGDDGELVARAPWAIEGRSIRLSGSIGEGHRIQVVHATRSDLLRASSHAADDAVKRAGGNIAGALVLACSGRIAALGDDFPSEQALIRQHVAAPIGGACVFGEIAKSDRDVDAFFNTTAVVVAFAA
jgi:hypothetical protein